jgi:hypothetical protein
MPETLAREAAPCNPRILGLSPAGSGSTLLCMLDIKRNGRLIRLGVGLAATAALAASAAPASAFTYNHKYSHLAFPPNSSHSQDRVLTLHGKYCWGVFGANQSKPKPSLQVRTVRLIGRYRMLDRVVPSGRSYRHYAEFINLRTGGKVQKVQVLNDGEGVYWWGSRISHGPC